MCICVRLVAVGSRSRRSGVNRRSGSVVEVEATTYGALVEQLADGDHWPAMPSTDDERRAILAAWNEKHAGGGEAR